MRLAVVGGRNVTLRCPHAGRRSGSPSWSRSFAGKQQIVCPHASTVGQMLIIPDVQLADSGLYHCDGKPAAYLKVIKEEKSDSGENKTVNIKYLMVVTLGRGVVCGSAAWEGWSNGFRVWCQGRFTHTRDLIIQSCCWDLRYLCVTQKEGSWKIKDI